MKLATVGKHALSTLILTLTLFSVASYLWRTYIISTISDTFPWGFPFQFYTAWGPCPPGEICSESNIFYFILDVIFWYVVSAYLVFKAGEKRNISKSQDL